MKKKIEKHSKLKAVFLPIKLNQKKKNLNENESTYICYQFMRKKG